MSDSVEEWLSQATQADFKVWVENPETVKESGFMGKTYTTFRVLMKSSETELVTIRHRFSEFCSLRDILKDRYTPYGILVPSLPQKKVIGALEKEFVTERMQGLTLFCEALVANPWLRKDPSWLEFMASSAPPTPTRKGQELVKTPSEQVLQNIMDRLPSPSTPLERIYELKEEITALERHLQGTLDATRVVQKHQVALNLANQSLHAAFDGWTSAETNPNAIYLNARSYEANSCALKLRDEEKVPILISKMTSSLADRVMSTQDLAEYSNVLLSTYIEHEIARLVSLRELLKYHDDTVTAIDNQRVKVEKLEAQPSTKLDVLQEGRKQLDVKKLQLSNFYKGFYFFTLPLNAKHRSSNLRKMVSNYGSTQLVTSYTILTSSKTLMRDLSINPIQAISDTSQILDMLSLKPLDEPPEGLPGPGDGTDGTGSLSASSAASLWVESLFYSAIQSSTAPGLTTVPPPSPIPSSPKKVAPGTQTASVIPAVTQTSINPSTEAASASAVDDLFSSKMSSNPFDNVDTIVAAPSICVGAEKGKGSANESKSSTPTQSTNQNNSIKINPVASTAKVNQDLLGDLLGDSKKDKPSSIWG